MNDEQTAATSNFVTARELNLAVSFLSANLETLSKTLSEKLDDGFKVTHEKQDHTNGRLLRAESAIVLLQRVEAADIAVASVAEKARNRMDTWRVVLLSSGLTSTIGAIVWLIKKAFP
jgi:hypothetical protein